MARQSPLSTTVARSSLRNQVLRSGWTYILAAVSLAFVLSILTPGLFGLPDPNRISARERLIAPLTAGHILGTDHLGRDLLSRTVYGARSSLFVAAGATVISVLSALVIGVLAGYFRHLDNLLMRIMDGLMAFPAILLAIAVVATLGSSALNIMLALGVVATPPISRVVRSQVLAIREHSYVEASRALGSTHGRVILLDVLPNLWAPITIQASFFFARAILTESGLSFLGLGIPPSTPSWGGMLGEARGYLSTAPWTVLIPGAALSIAIIGINLIGDFLQDRLDPRFAGPRRRPLGRA